MSLEPTTTRRPGDKNVTSPPPVPAALRYSPGMRAAVERRSRRGEVQRVRRGVYLPAPDGGAAGTPSARRQALVLARVRGAAEVLRTAYWFSHATAAVLHGLWTWRLADTVHVTQLRPPSGDALGDEWLERHWTKLPARDRTELDGLPVTTIERTIVDCARTLPGAQALVVANSGLRAGADPERVATILAEASRRRGVRAAREVLALATPASESVGEGVVRWIIHDGRLPAPVVGHPVGTWAGTFWLDLAWPDLRIAIEFDGAVKYSGGEYGDPREVLLAEKRRQDALTELGWVVVRISWDDLSDPERILARLRAARRRAAR
jgi:hypothetical protein